MTELYIIVWFTILLLITQPGMALAMTLLLPGVTERAALRLEQTPGMCFITGGVLASGVILIAVVAGSVIAPAVGAGIAVIGMGFYAVGAAGMSRLFGDRIAQAAFRGRQPVRDTLVGGVALELACFVPLVGWFMFFPLVLVLNTGAAAFALVGWMPRAVPEVA